MSMSGGSPMSTLRSFTRDSSVTQQKLAPGTAKRILAFARPYRIVMIFFIVTLIIDSLLVVAQPLLFKRIVDQGITPGNSTVVVSSALLIALLAVAVAGLTLVSRWWSARIGEGLIFDLRTQVFHHVQQQPIAFFTRAQTGSLVSRLNNDVIGAQQAFTSTLQGVLGNVITLVTVLVAMFVLSWQITLIALALLPIFLVPAKWMGRRLQVLTRQQMQDNADLGNQMTERFNVAGALLVKLFGRPTEEDTQFAERAGALRDVGIKIAMANRYFFVALALIGSLATAIAYGIGGVSVISGTMTLGTLLALTGLLAMLYGPLTALSNVRIDIMTALVSFDRVFELLDLEPVVPEPIDPVSPRGDTATLVFRNVSFSYPRPEDISLASLESVARTLPQPEGEVLHRLSFEVGGGQMVAIVGPSGAGKTTLTALMSRLYDPTEGVVELNGVDLRQVSREELTRWIGHVTQDSHLFHATIRDNLLYAQPGATAEQLWEALEQAQVAELVRSLNDGLDTVVGDRGHRLSGGEKQRIAIARVLLKKPQLVILDEATAHLDSRRELEVQRALDSALSGRTAVVIAHRLSTIRAADRILVLDHGEMVGWGTHQELMGRDGLYRHLYVTQFGGEQSESPESPARPETPEGVV